MLSASTSLSVDMLDRTENGRDRHPGSRATTPPVELAGLGRLGLARGHLLGSPWNITEHGQLRSTDGAAVVVRTWSVWR
jgi:hypothetical protein